MDATSTPAPEVVTFDGATTAVICAVVPVDELAGFFDHSFARLAAVISDQEVPIVSPAFALYHGPPTDTADLEVGFVTESAVQADNDVHAGSLPSGPLARTIHSGGYDELGSSWQRLRSWIDERSLVPGRDLWEVYVTEPSPDMNPADLRTELNWSLIG